MEHNGKAYKLHIGDPAVSAHGGQIRGREIRSDFSVNTNPYGMPPKVKCALSSLEESCETYPSLSYRELRSAVAAYEKRTYLSSAAPMREALSEDHIVVGSGASELIMALAHANREKKVLLQAPAFSGYERAFLTASCDVRYMEQGTDFSIASTVPSKIRESKPDIVMLAQPSNPVGAMCDPALLKEIVSACIETGSLFVSDECFLVFLERAGERSVASQMLADANFVVLRAFTKAFAMPGVRLGYALCSKRDTANALRAQLPEWNVSGIAESLGVIALSEADLIKEQAASIREERKELEAELVKRGCNTVKGEANYIFFSSD
nr:aminotransferase class I/II-fold pyridoxal phosphate-dependent enzyme [Lachnospiraceae bacterium]